VRAVNPKVLIIMGSDSDWDVMKQAALTLYKFDVPFEVHVASAHRTPERVLALSKEAHTRGVEVIIAGAGAAAHLPGVAAAMTPLPVIGVPINATALMGTDALYAMVQMPSGVPVATVALDGASNAALLAVQILGIGDAELRNRFIRFKGAMAEDVSVKHANVQRRVKDLLKDLSEKNTGES
jgi:phosphoribosylaminoimidazole carboxylase PurE protein